MSSNPVLVDTDVWSEFYRKRAGEPSMQVVELRGLIRAQRVALLGAVRQETLCGWRYQHQFEQIRDLLAAFPDQPVQRQQYELAAEYFNLCRSKGIQGSHTDFLLCACSAAWQMPIMTKDGDYARYAEHVPVLLYSPN